MLGRTGQAVHKEASDHAVPALVGSTSWHAVIEQAREKAVQETNRALADASDDLKTLLVNKIEQLADLCGFVVKVSQSHDGELHQHDCANENCVAGCDSADSDVPATCIAPTAPGISALHVSKLGLL